LYITEGRQNFSGEVNLDLFSRVSIKFIIVVPLLVRDWARVTGKEVIFHSHTWQYASLSNSMLSKKSYSQAATTDEDEKGIQINCMLLCPLSFIGSGGLRRPSS
jgi:hypothetical protein